MAGCAPDFVNVSVDGKPVIINPDCTYTEGMLSQAMNSAIANAKLVAKIHCQQGNANCEGTTNNCVAEITSQSYKFNFEKKQDPASCTLTVTTTISGKCKCEEEQQQVGIVLPEDLFGVLTVRAAKEKKGVSEIISTILRKELG